jgi:hypothetical protein
MVNLLGDTAKISRDDTKQAIMTAFYSSKAVPKQVFGEGALLQLFYQTLVQLAPAAWELNEAMLALWNPNAFEHSWVLPDNFHVHIKVMRDVHDTVHFINEPFEVHYKINAPTDEGRSLGANNTHSIDGMIVRELTRRCDYSPVKVENVRKMLAINSSAWGTRSENARDQMLLTLWGHYLHSGYLSARILDYLHLDNLGHVDPVVITELLDSLPAKPFKVISIHDCFRCHPNYGNDLRRQYNLQLKMIAESNLLSYIISQMTGRPTFIQKLEPTLHAYVGSTNYALS